MGQQRPGATNGRGTDADYLANSLLSMRRDERPHVCGRCRNPWTNGNPDCPNNRRNR